METKSEQSQKRLAILEKIKEYEENGWFDRDLEEDPETIELLPNKVDYLNKKLSSKIATHIAFKSAWKFVNQMIKAKQLVVKEILGLENLKNLSTGAIITCNHFNPFDSFATELAFHAADLKKKKMYRVIREGNYTSFEGFYGFLMRHCRTLPLSSNKRTMINFMKAVDTILTRGDFILVYPEQSLWWNYRKPKPLKDGAFKLAVRSNVPVLPVFITMEDTDVMDAEGFPVQEYTIHIEKPIQEDKNLSKKENIQLMKEKNFEIWKKVYEDFYKTPLTYTTKQ